MSLSEDAARQVNEWKVKLPGNSDLGRELAAMEKDEALLAERFGAELSFGTAGLRGKLGPGTNAMNLVTVRRASEGLARYIEKYFGKTGAVVSSEAGPDGNDAENATDAGKGNFLPEKAVCIAFDPRHMSREFAELSAAVFASHGIRVYTFESIRPTPELAYLIRAKGTVSGLNITASHNPKDYNGYKVYWADGCQISGDVSKGIAAEIEALPYFPETGASYGEREGKEARPGFPEAGTSFLDAASAFDAAKAAGFITICGEVEDRAYLDTIRAVAVHTDPCDLALDIPIVYTPLNGAGSIPFMRIMKERGFTNVHIVEEQKSPDPDFTTVGYPNPEDPKAFALAEKLGLETGAEVLLATDPDSDRFAIEIRNHAADSNTRNADAPGKIAADAARTSAGVGDGNIPAYIPMNGNQTGYLLLSYILEGRREPPPSAPS